MPLLLQIWSHCKTLRLYSSHLKYCGTGTGTYVQVLVPVHMHENYAEGGLLNFVIIN